MGYWVRVTLLNRPSVQVFCFATDGEAAARWIKNESMAWLYARAQRGNTANEGGLYCLQFFLLIESCTGPSGARIFYGCRLQRAATGTFRVGDVKIFPTVGSASFGAMKVNCLSSLEIAVNVAADAFTAVTLKVFDLDALTVAAFVLGSPGFCAVAGTAGAARNAAARNGIRNLRDMMSSHGRSTGTVCP